MHQRLVVAIESLLAEGISFTEISVERLCTEASISRSTFYTHFEDKGQLLRAITGDTLQLMGNIAQDWWSRGTEITREEIRDVLLRLVTAYRDHSSLFVALSETSAYDEVVREAYTATLDGFIGEISSMIDKLKAEGRLPADTHSREIATMLSWMAERSYMFLARSATDADLEKVADAQTEILWQTLYVAR